MGKGRNIEINGLRRLPLDHHKSGKETLAIIILVSRRVIVNIYVH